MEVRGGLLRRGPQGIAPRLGRTPTRHWVSRRPIKGRVLRKSLVSRAQLRADWITGGGIVGNVVKVTVFLLHVLCEDGAVGDSRVVVCCSPEVSKALS